MTDDFDFNTDLYAASRLTGGIDWPGARRHERFDDSPARTARGPGP